MFCGVVGVVDHGVGNYVSIINLLNKIGVRSIRIRNVLEINSLNPKVDRIIIPGVGSFDSGMLALKNLKIFEGIRKFSGEGGGILGICLGMQLLFDSSEEGFESGLGLIPGKLKLIQKDSNHRVPHVGWHFVESNDNEWLFENIKKMRFYHNHSFALSAPSDFQIATIKYSEEDVVSVKKENIIGVQFHPEKSHSSGERLILNFLNHGIDTYQK
jgi:glutamine amidotransferase